MSLRSSFWRGAFAWRATFAALALSGAGAAGAAEFTVPSDPVAKAAFDMLDRHCARCHQAGKLEEGREKPAKGFGNILDLDAIAGNPARVLRGNPDASRIVSEIIQRRMPDDAYSSEDPTKAPKPVPTEVELNALRDWIASLGAPQVAGCDAAKPITASAIVDLVARDLQSLPKHRVAATRYLTITHLRNACEKPEAMQAYREGAIKFVNSLGRTSDVARLEPVDPDRTILRINLQDLGWSPGEWESLLAIYPYGVKAENPMFGFTTQATGSALPFIRADWLVYTAARPPLYDVLLRLPKTYQELQRQQGVDVDRNIAASNVKRAGFLNSGVSDHNRLIERHSIATGYFWTSYDFGGDGPRQDLFTFPLGPSGEGFRHDGGEMLWSLPNGFQGYYLSTAAGRALDKGPTNIVHDVSQKDKTVTNGVSCMGCHDAGIKFKQDEIRASVQRGDRTSFPKPVRDAVAALYPPVPDMDAQMKADAERFARALTAAGLTPGLKLGGVEPVNALALRFDAPLDLRLAAAELGVAPDALAKANLAGSQNLLARLQQAAVPRTRFEGEFAALVKGATDDDPATYGGARPITTLPPPPAPAAQAASSRTFDLALTSDKTSYRAGDNIVLTVRSEVDCNLTVVDVDEKNVATILFPNKFRQNNAIRGGQTVVLGQGPDFFFRPTDRGLDRVTAFCLIGQKYPPGFEPNFTGVFTGVGDYTRAVTRSIGVVGPGGASGAASAPAPAPPAAASAQTAIRVAIE